MSSVMNHLDGGSTQQEKEEDGCQKPLMRRILSVLKYAPPGSVLTVVTDSGAYDSDLYDDVIKLAVDRMVQVR